MMKLVRTHPFTSYDASHNWKMAKSAMEAVKKDNRVSVIASYELKEMETFDGSLQVK